MQSYPFEFSTEKPYETYSGMNVRLRYFVRVTITRSYNTVVKEQDFAVQNYVMVRSNPLNPSPWVIFFVCIVHVFTLLVTLSGTGEPAGDCERGSRTGHQDGGGHRGLPAHRVRVRQAKVPPQGTHCRPALLSCFILYFLSLGWCCDEGLV